MTTFLDDEDKYMPIVIASSDGKAMAATVKMLTELAYSIGRIPALVVVTTSGLLMARQVGLAKLREYFQHNPRGFIIDSDIELVGNSALLAEYVTRADAEKCSFVGAYLSKSGIVDIQIEQYKQMEPADYATLSDWSNVKFAGLGFYYGEIPMDYEFKFDSKFDRNEGLGEDYHFFNDHPQFKTKLAKKLILGHYKTVRLIIPEVQ